MTQRLDLRDEERWVGAPPKGWGKANRTGLVLSGGGLKFAVHAGLYDRLERLPYREADGTSGPALADLFDCVVGTSAGSLLATAIACGFMAEDVWRFSTVFSRPGFQPYVLDPNWLGVGSFLLKGDLGYLKGLYRGEAIARTLAAYFSHNFLIELGRLYEEYGRKSQKPDAATIETAMGDLLRSLSRLPLDRLPQMADTVPDPEQPKPTKSGQTLRLITFQDLNPGVRVPFEHYMHTDDPQWRETALTEARRRLTDQQTHAAQYREALATYYRGRAAAGLTVPADPTLPRPMLMVVGTDIVTGQKTVFANYNLFEKELVYSTAQTPAADKVSYRYINQNGHYSQLPGDLTEALRPVNYLYKYLSDGLPVAWATRASLSIPGVFAPAQIEYRDESSVTRTDFFVDGGVTDNYALQLAGDPNLGRCQRILGGNIGNLGPRTHDYGVRDVTQILVRTLLIQGDGNVDANAEDRLLDKTAVITINELTPTDVGSLREVVKIPQLLVEGGQLADQFFAAFRTGDGSIGLDALFGKAGDYTVFLPRIEIYGQPPGTLAPPISGIPVTCGEQPTGSSEIDRIQLKLLMNKTAKDATSQTRSEQLGKCEAGVTPSPLRSPGGWLFGILSWFGPANSPVPVTDLVNLGRLGVLSVGLLFISLFNLGLWRLVLLIWQAAGAGDGAAQWFDSWSYWPLLATIVLTALGHFVLYFRLFIFDYWVARSAKVVRRGLESLLGLALYLLPLWWLGSIPRSTAFWPAWFVPGLVAISSGALLFVVYTVITFSWGVGQLVKGQQKR